MKLTTPKKQAFTDSKIFYVSSERNPKTRYIVVKTRRGFFCQCIDFFTRSLPLTGTPNFSNCKHILFVKDRLAAIPRGNSVYKKKFGFFYNPGGIGRGFQSLDFSQEFSSREAAEKFIQTRIREDIRKNYKVRPL